MYKIVFSIALSSILSACVPQSPAEIKYHHKAAISDNRAKKSSITTHSTKIKTNADLEQKVTSRPIVKEDKDYDNTRGILHEKKPVSPVKKNNEEKVLPDALLVRDQITYHEVQSGETIEDIAQKYDKSVEEITSFNQLSLPYELDESQIIKIKNTKLPATKSTIDQKEINKPQSNLLPLKEVEFDKPLTGRIIADFEGQNTNHKSNGINIAAQKGTKINSICNGKIVFSGAHPKFGNLIIVKADKLDIHIAYAHMEELVHKKGEEIKRGEAIGYVGSSGEVDIPQLYLAMKKGKTYVDPAKYITFDN